MHKFECRINIFFRKKAEISEIDTLYLYKIQKKTCETKKKTKKIEANNVDNENSENRREETISFFFIRFHFF